MTNIIELNCEPRRVNSDNTVAPSSKNKDNFDALLQTVGQRVKTARAKKKMSRRVLSERSGVSQRYLAQLESGSGNISIGLLLRVSNALGVQIEGLVSQQDPWNSELALAKQLLNNASSSQRAKVLELLQQEGSDVSKEKRIALIGLRGAGKSTLGSLASKELGVPFQELNDVVESISGLPIQEVFSLYGEEGYRQLERQALEQIVAASDETILAISGGVVSSPDSFNYVLSHFHTIWLQAAPEEHMARVRKQGDERPMAGRPDAMKDLQQILQNRQSEYARSDYSLDTTKVTAQDSLREIVGLITEKGFLTKAC